MKTYGIEKGERRYDASNEYYIDILDIKPQKNNEHDADVLIRYQSGDERIMSAFKISYRYPNPTEEFYGPDRKANGSR